jgi:FAD/FMN-containing dehydrogenase
LPTTCARERGDGPVSAEGTAPVVEALERELVQLLGPEGVSTSLRVRRKASIDGSTMSPILAPQLPIGLADIVAFPQNAEQVSLAVAAATRYEVPVTARGRGTGNYGQGLPLLGGLVLDTSRARAITGVGDGYITAEAGTPMVQLERAAVERGQQLWMYPSTVQSSIGGFLSGGSAGTGTIAHGANWQGFVLALEVVHMTQSPGIAHLDGPDAQPYVHSYGTIGVIARASVRLEPLQDWHALYASFESFAPALHLVRELRALEPCPRLVSADPAPIVNGLPPDSATPPGRASLRAILDASTVAFAQRLVGRAGGTVNAVRSGSQAGIRVSLLSYNHPVYWLQRSFPQNTYFHVEVANDALIDRFIEVEAAYPGGMLHVEAAHEFPIGMLVAPYVSAEEVVAGYERLRQLDVLVHSPHQYYVDFNVEEARALKAKLDPAGLLNPGKLV